MLKSILLALASIASLSFSAIAEDDHSIKVKVTVGNQILSATFYDNATSRALISQFPMTLQMQDLYNREMCYRFANALPANETQTGQYEIGDIVYWAPRHSFVIMYEQNNEKISQLQKVGRIQSGVEIFKQTGDVAVKFELSQ